MDNNLSSVLYKISKAYCQQFSPDDLLILEINKENLVELTKLDIDRRSNAMGSGFSDPLGVEIVLLIVGVVAKGIAHPYTPEFIAKSLQQWRLDPEMKKLERNLSISEMTMQTIIDKIIKSIESIENGQTSDQDSH